MMTILKHPGPLTCLSGSNGQEAVSFVASGPRVSLTTFVVGIRGCQPDAFGNSNMQLQKRDAVQMRDWLNAFIDTYDNPPEESPLS